MEQLIRDGRMFVGCNYWASHAGIYMWQDWKPEVIEEDFRLLSENDIRVLRIFPLWSDFQPLRMHHGGSNQTFELRLGEDPLPQTKAGQAGINEIMADRFSVLLDLADRYGLKLIIGLVTGWMSGRMFAPEAFHDRNLLSDPMVTKWQIKYVRYMVRRFRDYPAVSAWDLGNECNCMSPVADENEAYVWAAMISMAIKIEDQSHPVFSGMHGLRPEGTWRMQDQAEFLDVLTTHPYPLFVPYCATDPINRMKSALHAAAESQMYHDLSSIPCFAEEAGTLGPMVCSEKIAADYVQASVFTVWAHNCYGFLWWCANEQSALERTPYDWCAVERELGLFHLDKSPKPVVEFLRSFSEFTRTLPFDTLPEQKTDAVCILTRGQDSWAVAYGAFILAKQAHIHLRFVLQTQEIPEADFYLLPSLKGSLSIDRHVLVELLERVQNGARLYISEDDALLSPFTEYSGLEVQTRAEDAGILCADVCGTKLEFKVNVRLETVSVGAEVLLKDDQGLPFLTRNSYGRGSVYFLNAPVERLASTEPRITDGEKAKPYYRIYQMLDIKADRDASLDDPYIGLTEHRLNANETILICVNYESEDRTAEIRLRDGWRLRSCASVFNQCAASQEGRIIRIGLKNNTGAVLTISAPSVSRTRWRYS